MFSPTDQRDRPLADRVGTEYLLVVVMKTVDERAVNGHRRTRVRAVCVADTMNTNTFRESWVGRNQTWSLGEYEQASHWTRIG